MGGTSFADVRVDAWADPMSSPSDRSLADDVVACVRHEILAIACLIEAEADACLWPEEQDRLRALAVKVRARAEDVKA